MRIAVTGSTGLIGKALVSELRSAGHSVTRVVRASKAASQRERLIAWDPESGFIDAAALEGHSAIVHLAGEPIFGVWTQAKKQAILDSRVRGTTLLARTIAALRQPPRILISASAVGYYGNRPANESIDEQASKGHGFLADVTEQWESATQLARAAGTRIVNTRFGLVLSPKGGALGVMVPIFQAGLGGKLGAGDQIWSWVTLPDVVGAIRHALAQETLSGPINIAAPGAVSNEEFTRALGQVLHRPTLFTVPAFVMRLVLREMADEMLLSGARIVPRKLLDTGYQFLNPELEPALQSLLQRS